MNSHPIENLIVNFCYGVKMTSCAFVYRQNGIRTLTFIVENCLHTGNIMRPNHRCISEEERELFGQQCADTIGYFPFFINSTLPTL